MDLAARGRSHWAGLIGGIVLMLYGVVPTLQPEHNFGRIYAAYGGVFVVMSLLWGWLVDRKTPDTFDIVGIFTLPIAVLGHELSEFAVIGNGLRMLKG